MQFRFRPVVARPEWRLAIALPVTAPATPAASSSSSSLARLTFADRTTFAALRLAEAVFFSVVILLRDCRLGYGVVCDGLLRSFARFTSN